MKDAVRVRCLARRSAASPYDRAGGRARVSPLLAAAVRRPLAPRALQTVLDRRRLPAAPLAVRG